MKIRSLAVAGVMAASMAALGVGTAHAGVIPQPSPSDSISVSPNFGGQPSPCPTPIRTISPNDQQQFGQGDRNRCAPTPVPVRRVRQRPESFNVLITSTGINYVRATGPVSGLGSDSSVSDTFDRFNLPTSSDRVNVLHTGTAMPTLDLRGCNATLTQTGAWAFAGGTGVDLHATGHGTFTLVELAHFGTIRGQCALRFVRGNALTQQRINPDFVAVAVHGSGVASR